MAKEQAEEAERQAVERQAREEKERVEREEMLQRAREMHKEQREKEEELMGVLGGGFGGVWFWENHKQFDSKSETKQATTKREQQKTK